jgi:hypothetical protein
MLTFYEWLEQLAEATSVRGAKFGLYPPGYDGIGLYPLPYYVAGSADVMYYMDVSDLHYYGYEGMPFKITHLPGVPKPPNNQIRVKQLPPSTAPGKAVPPKGHGMPGKEVRPTKWHKHPKFPPSDMDGNGGKVISL